MPVPFKVFDLDNLVKRYEAGESMESLAAKSGSRGVVLKRAMIRAGVTIRGCADAARVSANAIRFENPQEIVARYQAGESEKHLADELKVARNVIARILREAGVERRHRSDAERLKWAKLKLDRRAVERQCAAAWSARTGSADTPATLHQRAAAHQRLIDRVGRYEREIAAALFGAGFTVTPQCAEGSYNIDVAVNVPRVAVEVQCTNHRKPTCSIGRKRVEYLLDRQWAVLMIYVPFKACLDIEAASKQVVAFAKRASRTPAMLGQYGMIGRDAQPFTPRRFDLPRRPRVPGF